MGSSQSHHSRLAWDSNTKRAGHNRPGLHQQKRPVEKEREGCGSVAVSYCSSCCLGRPVAKEKSLPAAEKTPREPENPKS